MIQNIEEKSLVGLIPSPDFPPYNSIAEFRKAAPTTELSFAGGAFIDDDSVGKRTRGFSNFSKPKSGGKASSKGERTS